MTHSNSKRQNTVSQKENVDLKPLNVVEKNVLQAIIGQDDVVRNLLVAIYRHINFNSLKSNILLAGKTGTGKTEMIKQICQALNLVYSIEDATKYTQEGYYGSNVSDMFAHLVQNAKGNIPRAQNGILVIDEIDKKKASSDILEKDVGGSEVLNSLLKLIESSNIPIKVQKNGSPYPTLFNFNTSKVLIIMSGAFTGIEAIKKKRLNKNSLGFKNSDDIEKTYIKDTDYLKKDFIEYGIPEEFMGRINAIIHTNDLTKQNLSDILKKSKLSVFQRYVKELERKYYIKLKYNRDIFDKLAEMSLSIDSGARELENSVNFIFEKILYELFTCPFETYSVCELGSNITQDNTDFKLY